MESMTRKKITTVALASLFGLALASGSAFAGKGDPNWDSGNKTGGGTDNKKTRGCPSDYIGPTGTYYNSAYDLNSDGLICYQWSANGTELSWVDNITNTNN
jgi:hypothetical protein